MGQEDDASFEGYKSETTSPGIYLLFFTLMYCVICLSIVLFRPNKSAKLTETDEEDDLTANPRRGVHGKKRYGGNFTKLYGKSSAEGKQSRRSRVQISRGLGPQRNDIESIEESTKKGSVTTLDDHSKLEFDELIPMWDKLGLKQEMNKDPEQQKGGFRMRGLSSYVDFRPVFSKRHKSVREGKPKEKKPLVGLRKKSSVTPNEKSAPLLVHNNSGKDSITSKNAFLNSLDSDDSTEESSKESDEEAAIENEMKEVFKLAAPWTVVSVISYSADFLLVLIISHFMGNAAMITYSNVWFIIGFFNLVSGGIYGSCYKHVNNAIADGSSHLVGEYIQISIILNTLISVPACIAAVCFMETIMAYYGYVDAVVNMSASYATVASISYILEGNLGMACTVLDIDGHAKFNAVWGLWESLGSILFSLFVIIAFEPTLLQLGIIHVVEGIIENAVYIYVVYSKKGWMDAYIGGMTSPSAIQNSAALISLIKRSIPLLLDYGVQSLEWFILSLFAAHQGAAEAVVWILLSYIWAIIEVIPESYTEAVSSRVAHNLSAGNVDIAEYIAAQSLLYGTTIAVVLSVPLLIFRNFIVWLISVDEVLEVMLLALLPYIAVCQPFITLGMIATSLNEALCMYHHAVKIMLAASCLVTLPAAGVMTYILGYNIEGLAAAVCMGYVTGGLWNFNMFVNADWDRAVRKNQEVTKYTGENKSKSKSESPTVSTP